MIVALLALQYALPIDTTALKQASVESRVPVEVVYAVKWMETRVGRAERALGPGREQCDSLGCRRVCREIGPMQVNPCIGFNLPECKELKAYKQNITCGVNILRYLYDRYGSWSEAVRRYNGSGPKSREYQQKALAYIGWLTLTRKL